MRNLFYILRYGGYQMKELHLLLYYESLIFDFPSTHRLSDCLGNWSYSCHQIFIHLIRFINPIPYSQFSWQAEW